MTAAMREKRFGIASLLVGVALAVLLPAGAPLGISLPRWAIVVAFAFAALLLLIGVGLLLHPMVVRVLPTGRGAPNLDVELTGGPGQDVRLVVTNRGRKADFQGTAVVVGTRNYPNNHRQGPYALIWLGRATNVIALDKGQSHALLLARWKIHDSFDPKDRMGEVQLIECNGSQEAEWDGFRWIFQPTEALPEFDIDVTLVGSGLSKLFRRSYTLRPSNWIGPLELIERPLTHAA